MFFYEFYCLILKFICYEDVGSLYFLIFEKKVSYFENDLLIRVRNY